MSARHRYATQGRVLIEALKKRPHTYMQMLDYGISASPWRRITECLRDTEQLIKAPNRQGLTTWRVAAATRWTA